MSRKSRDPFRKGRGRGASRRGPVHIPPRKEEPEKQPSRYGPALILVAVTIIIGGLALFYFYLIQPPARDRDAGSQDSVLPLQETVSIGGYDFIPEELRERTIYLNHDFIVNLSGLEGRKRLKVKVFLLLQTTAEKNRVVAELNETTSEYYAILDDITETIKKQTYAQLITSNGMKLLKDQIRDRLNANYFERQAVEEVFFANPIFEEALPPGRR